MTKSIKFNSILEPGGYHMHYIPVPDAIGEEIHSQMGKRVICEINGAEIHCAIQHRRNWGFSITVGKSTRKKICAQPGAELTIIVKKDETEFQLPMPEELEEVLATDPEAKHFFDALTPGKKRSIIHTVDKAKHIDTRINRALKIAEKLKLGFTDLKEIIR